MSGWLFGLMARRGHTNGVLWACHIAVNGVPWAYLWCAVGVPRFAFLGRLPRLELISRRQHPGAAQSALRNAAGLSPRAHGA